MTPSRLRSVPVFIVALAGFAWAQEADQDENPLGRFTTGPPTTAPLPVDRSKVRNSDDFRGRELSLPDGADMRVNVLTSSAQNETSFAVNPNDPLNWVGVANDYLRGTVETGWYSTLDGGQTWTTGSFGVDAGFSFSGDPSVCFTPAGDPVVICMMYAGPGGSKVTAFRSTDGGKTWNGGVQIDLDGADDKPQVECDLSDGPGNGRITTAWDRFNTASGSHIFVSSSTDGGLTWTPAVRINDDASVATIAPDVTFGPASEIYVAWADRGSLDIYLDKSVDGGATWGTDTLVASFSQVPSPIPGSTFRMFDIFSVAADASPAGEPHSGNVYVAYHTYESSDANIRVATSVDGGASFTNNVVVNADDTEDNDQVMPGIVVDSKGNVNVSFYDRRLDPSDFLLWTWVARSSDGGQTFANYRASDVGWNHQPTEFPGFIGDYMDIDASDRHVFPFWCDGRSASQDLFVDVMNLDLFTDVPEISAGTGGTAKFTINLGPNFAGDMYFLAGGSSGTSPGSTTGNVTIPINYDNWTKLTVKRANSAFFTNTMGILDSTGSATASLNTVGPRPFLSGLVLDWSVLVIDTNSGLPVHASAPTRVTFTP
jgi:hypothetical protein